MLDIILDTIIDSIKLLPFLFLSFLIIEFIEHKSSKTLEKILKNSGKFGSIIGAILGLVPQCGFSVTASNLYAGRVITLGTLISVFLATSDEAVIVMLSNPGNFVDIAKILLVKLIIGIIFGVIIDLLITSKKKLQEEVDEAHTHMHDICKNCDCEHEHGILKPTIKHTLSIFVFIFIITFILNTTIYLIGEDRLETLLLNGSIFQPFVAALIGLIPNCAASILITELYLAQKITFASVIAGLCSSAGVGLVVLFKVNKNLKENIKIVGLLYLIAVIVGLILMIV